MLRGFLQSGRIGSPQFLAAAALMVYLLECLWLAAWQARVPQHDEQQALRIYQGLQQWRGGAVAGLPGSVLLDSLPPAQFAGSSNRLELHAGSAERSPLYYLIAAAPLVPWPSQFYEARPLWRWLALTPALFFGVMLGGSLWYVTRRLYGNAGGYIALLLYCFSPVMIREVAATYNHAGVGAVWGAFGAMFTAIAVAHTLYAPREVVLWNWRRILLLGLSLALAVGNQFSLAVIAPAVLLFMLWVAPMRKSAVLAIWAAACLCALALLFASYSFRPARFWEGMTRAAWLDFEPRALGMWFSYAHVLGVVLQGSPPLLLALPVALGTYLWWKRARYFGNTGPLLIALLMLVMAVGATFPGESFSLTATVFCFVFVAGTFADLLETQRRWLVTAGLSGLLIASAIWNLLQLARLARL